MRLCVLGGHGKTGKRVVDAARLMGHDVRVLEGDALATPRRSATAFTARKRSSASWGR